MIGTFIPQGQDSPIYEQLYGSTGAMLIQAVGLNDVFHSKLFVIVALTATVTTLICTINRVLPVWRQVTTFAFRYREVDYYTSLSKGQAFSSRDPGETADLLHSAFLSKRYRVFREKQEERYHLYADRGRFGFFGNLLIHFSLVVIVTGALLGGITEQKSYRLLSEGDSLNIQDLGFAVRLDDIRVNYYDNGMPKQYISYLSMNNKGQETIKKTISVNHPLTYQDVTFYQADYGWTVDGVVRIRNKDTRVTWTGGEMKTIGGGFNVEATFYPDFIESKLGPFGTKSPYPKNPRIVYIIHQGSQVYTQGVVKINEPVELKDGSSLIFTGYREYSGYTLSKDSGAWVVFCGLGLMVVGLFLNFYWVPRKVWAVIIPEPSGSRVLLSGSTTRYPALLDRVIGEFAQGAVQAVRSGLGRGDVR